jgi:hypothetical protein
MASYKSSTVKMLLAERTYTERKQRDNSRKASFGNSTVEKLLYLPHIIKKSIRI